MNIQILKKDSKKGFKKLVGINRETAPAHIAKLKKSISEIGMLQAIIVAELSFITGKKETYIIEGQHKYEACMALGIDIPYVTIHGISNYEDLVKTIALLNSSSKSWKLDDYIHAWSSIKPDYRKLMVIYNKYDIEITIAAGILSNTGFFFGHRINSALKTGTFTVVNEGPAELLVSQTSEVMKLMPEMGRTCQKYFIQEFVNTVRSLGKAYDHNVMLRYIGKQKQTIAAECIDEQKVKDFFTRYAHFITAPAEKKQTKEVSL
jgi:hypothetical protein